MSDNARYFWAGRLGWQLRVMRSGADPIRTEIHFVAEIRGGRAGYALPLNDQRVRKCLGIAGKDLESWWCPGLAGRDLHQDQGSLSATRTLPPLFGYALRLALGWRAAVILRGSGNPQRTGGELDTAEQGAMGRIPDPVAP